MSRPLPLIHINGFPGVGKLTIAKELTAQLADRAKLVHNHLLINPADAVLHRTQPGYQGLRRALRGAIFAALADEPATHATAYVFTDFQSSDAVGSATCAEYREAARRRGCALVPIVLSCGEEANLARLEAAERKVQGKIVDEQLLRYFRDRVEIHQFGDVDEMLNLDVTNLTPGEAAKAILDHLLTCCPELGVGLGEESAKQ